MRTSLFRSSRARTLLMLAILCLCNGFLFMDSWHQHGESTFTFGVILILSLLLMLAAMFLPFDR
jgi:hypothetical protein